MDPDRCPRDPEETAEFYLLGMLRPEDAAAFEDHYLTCAACAAMVEKTDQFVTALRAALEDANVRNTAVAVTYAASV